MREKGKSVREGERERVRGGKQCHGGKARERERETRERGEQKFAAHILGL